jgi:hydroxymethylpyrimidine/phosphomethylpyrimidine kinase
MSTVLSSAVPVVLTIAGSDSSGGAGIQADIKAISATGSYACSAITAITSQNTQGVSAIFPIPLDHIANQLDALFGDLNIAAVKIGMLADARIIDIVANKLEQYNPNHIVIDPVMVATSGDLLLEPSAIASLKQRLLPIAQIITPNLPEAAALISQAVPANDTEMRHMISELRNLNTGVILLKGGHLESSLDSNDLLIFPDHVDVFPAKRIITRNTHGTGCTLSSAIASYLAQGLDLHSAVERAKVYISAAIGHADQLNIGRGRGPVHHFYALHNPNDVSSYE